VCTDNVDIGFQVQKRQDDSLDNSVDNSLDVDDDHENNNSLDNSLDVDDDHANNNNNKSKASLFQLCLLSNIFVLLSLFSPLRKACDMVFLATLISLIKSNNYSVKVSISLPSLPSSLPLFSLSFFYTQKQ